jgi:hypothetical protein
MKIKSFALRKLARHFQAFGFACALLLISNSCTSIAFRTEANNFSSAYGDVLNEQMLLNLARLDNSHPAYFIAVGTLNSKWNLGATASGTFSRNPEDSIKTTETSGTGANPPGSVLGLASRVVETFSKVATGRSFGPGLESRVTPDFQLIPLNNEQLAQQVLAPTKTNVFFTLYEQGVPVDLLMRVLVEEIQTTFPLGARTVQRNDPTGGGPASYRDFLRICQVARDLQTAGLLRVEMTEGKFSPSGDAISTPPDPWVVLQTQVGGGVWKQQDGKWQLGRQQSGGLVFRIAENPPYYKAIAAGQRHMSDRLFVGQVVAALASTAVLGKTTQAGNEPKEEIERRGSGDKEEAFVILRSFSRALEAVGREQNNFPKDEPGIPGPQAEPVIRTKWSCTQLKPGRALGAVRYAGKQYVLADPAIPPGGRSKTWNRDVFRLLIALNSQVAVDISKFQRQVLEVR